MRTFLGPFIFYLISQRSFLSDYWKSWDSQPSPPPPLLLVLTMKSLFFHVILSSRRGSRFRGSVFHLLSWRNASLLEESASQATSSLVLINTLRLSPSSLLTSFPFISRYFFLCCPVQCKRRF